PLGRCVKSSGILLKPGAAQILQRLSLRQTSAVMSVRGAFVRDCRNCNRMRRSLNFKSASLPLPAVDQQDLYQGIISMASSQSAQSVHDLHERTDLKLKVEAASLDEKKDYASSKPLRFQMDLEDCREENRRLHSALKEMRTEMMELNRAVDRSALPEELDRLQLLARDQARRLDLMRASLSWRITAPLRLLSRWLGAK
ncbi:MAG: hypothetical protein ABI866_05545, partial [Dokdonella sp.]